MRAVLAPSVGVFVLLGAVLVGTAGCGSPAATPGATDAKVVPAPAAPAAAVAVREVRAAALETALKGHKDKVVLVDVWATWCAPCVKKFPHLVERHKTYAARGLVCVSVSLDKWEESAKEDGGRNDTIAAFLKTQGATFPNFILADPEAEEKQLGAVLGEGFYLVPYMALFDKAGRRVWDAAGKKLTDEQLDQLIAAELAK